MQKLLRNYLPVCMAVCAVSCAATPADIGAGARSVQFVQHGHKPLRYATGVIDTESFWATYGDAVSKQLGGSEKLDELTAESIAVTADREEHNELVVYLMYDQHDLADRVAQELMPHFAAAWQQPYEANQLMVVPTHTAFVDPVDDSLHGVITDADLVLLIEIAEVRLTERFSAGSALLNGVSLGTNEKSLTVETPVNLLAFRRTDETGKHVLAWSRRCGANYTSMKTSYRLGTLWDYPRRMTELLDEARARSIAQCRKILQTV